MSDWVHWLARYIWWLPITLWWTFLIVRDVRRRRRAPYRTFAGKQLPVSTAEVPILGFKAAGLDLDTFQFLPIVYGRSYGVDDDAQCGSVYHLGRIHRGAPVISLSCTCGFYALASGHTNQLLVGAGPLILEVELSGTVIVAEYGYRAQHQRVLKVWLGLCDVCHIRRAVTIVKPHDNVFTVCATCLPACAPWATVVSPAEAAARLGVPVAEGVPPAA